MYSVTRYVILPRPKQGHAVRSDLERPGRGRISEFGRGGEEMGHPV